MTEVQEDLQGNGKELQAAIMYLWRRVAMPGTSQIGDRHNPPQHPAKASWHKCPACSIWTR